MNETRVLLSMFDRLRPKTYSGTDRWRRTSSVESLRASVVNHLVQLLNTRRSRLPEFDGFPLLGKTVLAYGVRDVANIGSDQDAVLEAFAEAIQDAIRTFEPRLLNVAVTGWFLEGKPVFRIKADLRVDPIKERISFSAEVLSPSGRLELKPISSDA